MENRSRVVRYQELRDKIAKMDSYSFVDENHQTNGNKPLSNESIDKLLDDKKEAIKYEEIKQRHAVYQKKKHTFQLKKWHIITLVSVIFALLLATFIVLFILGVF